MTQSEIQALLHRFDGITLQLADVSAKVQTLSTGQALIEQRLNSERAAAARETELVKQLAELDAKFKTQMAAKEIEVKEKAFNFHLRILTGIVLLLAFASFPQIYAMWKAFKP